MPTHIGEVIESKTTQFICQATELHRAPDFGSFVQVQDEHCSIVGVVYNTTTVSSDPSRKPVAYGQTEDELRRQQPQIFQLLRTYFDVLVVGYYQNHQYCGFLPPQPSRIHSFVQQCSDGQYKEISQNINYISAILSSGCECTDELVAALIRNCSRYHDDATEYQRRVGSELRRLLAADYERFKTIIRRVRQ
ncbi:MAG: hypothetical protein FH758_09110 [Firmicutes bacterium]|nr:hypothetical protein [Bacillota bacterium]